jgi:hypothetical protein
MIIHAKQQFFLNSNDFLDENSSDPKLFWSLVKKLMGNVGRSCTCSEAFFIFRDFNISEISFIVNSIIANFEFVLNSNLGGLQLLSSKFDMEQKKLFRRLHLIEFTIKEISDILKSLNIKKPPGTI